jgi:hypothetical protein
MQLSILRHLARATAAGMLGVTPMAAGTASDTCGRIHALHPRLDIQTQQTLLYQSASAATSKLP